jgi:hypothetical protein
MTTDSLKVKILQHKRHESWMKCALCSFYIILCQLTAFQLSDHLIWLQPKSDKLHSQVTMWRGRPTDIVCCLSRFFPICQRGKILPRILGLSSTIENYLVIHDERVFDVWLVRAGKRTIYHFRLLSCWFILKKVISCCTRLFGYQAHLFNLSKKHTHGWRIKE